MMHSKIRTTFIGTHESVYRDSPAGKLDTKIAWVKDMHPLQQGFEQGYPGDIYIAFGASSHP